MMRTTRMKRWQRWLSQQTAACRSSLQTGLRLPPALVHLLPGMATRRCLQPLPARLMTASWRRCTVGTARVARQHRWPKTTPCGRCTLPNQHITLPPTRSVGAAAGQCRHGRSGVAALGLSTGQSAGARTTAAWRTPTRLWRQPLWMRPLTTIPTAWATHSHTRTPLPALPTTCHAHPMTGPPSFPCRRGRPPVPVRRAVVGAAAAAAAAAAGATHPHRRCRPRHRHRHRRQRLLRNTPCRRLALRQPWRPMRMATATTTTT